MATDVASGIGGTDSAPSPHEYLEVALAACTALTLQMYAQRKGLKLDYADVQVRITAEGKSNEMLREIKLVGNLNDGEREQLLAIAEKCPVHKFLSAGAVVTSQLV